MLPLKQSLPLKLHTTALYSLVELTAKLAYSAYMRFEVFMVVTIKMIVDVNIY
jgi:hypothetical protein